MKIMKTPRPNCASLARRRMRSPHLSLERRYALLRLLELTAALRRFGVELLRRTHMCGVPRAIESLPSHIASCCCADNRTGATRNQ